MLTLCSLFPKDMSFMNDNDDSQIIQMGRIEINANDFNQKVNTEDLPILPTRNLVLFPKVTIPITITRESTLRLAKEASEKKFPVGVVCQLDPSMDNPTSTEDLYKYGVVADILKVFELPDGSKTAIVHGRQRFRIFNEGRGEGKIYPDAISARVRVLNDRTPIEFTKDSELMNTIVAKAKAIFAKSNNGEANLVESMKMLKDPQEILNLIATNLPTEPEEKEQILARADVYGRANETLKVELGILEKMQIYDGIMRKAQSKMNESQRNAFLQSQMEALREELYGGVDIDSDVQELKEKAEQSSMPDYARMAFDKELAKLQRLNMNSPDYSVQYAYLETLVDLPWKSDKIDTDISRAKEVLDKTHFGLDKVNQRILEQIAVLLSAKGRIKAPILCLVGPPGVGKTSLGRAIAEAMGRKYRRVALGGVHDESEIRGHRRTYIGAMPGRIIKAIKEAGTMNPVLLLDEVDKLGHDHRGDPASALLEVLDPEQNITFHDNYVDLDYDLSDVLFIATANNLAGIDGPLRDRMEIIELAGYLPEEKVEIAKRHLIPKVLIENGVESSDSKFDLSDEAIMTIIDEYTAESGVRSLEKNLAALVRKMLLAELSGAEFPKRIQPSDIKELLGNPKFNKDRYEGNEIPGVVTGLAWTAAGGEILLAEASLSPGKGNQIVITGNLGDVMKESATIAYEWVKAHHEQLGITAEDFTKFNLHIHFPEGAIPKDGPSAGITIATAIASIFTKRRVAERLAMTGEITLRGRVLPVGGIREKILAARRAGITTIILCEQNRKDVEEIPASYIEGIDFHYVTTVMEVIDRALLNL